MGRARRRMMLAFTVRLTSTTLPSRRAHRRGTLRHARRSTGSSTAKCKPPLQHRRSDSGSKPCTRVGGSRRVARPVPENYRYGTGSGVRLPPPNCTLRLAQRWAPDNFKLHAAHPVTLVSRCESDNVQGERYGGPDTWTSSCCPIAAWATVAGRRCSHVALAHHESPSNTGGHVEPRCTPAVWSLVQGALRIRSEV